VKERSRTFVEAQLKRGVFRTNGRTWSVTVSEILNTKRWRSHAQMIFWQDAQDPTIGLSVEYSSADDPAWQMHCLQGLAVKDGEKIFESGTSRSSRKAAVIEQFLRSARRNSHRCAAEQDDDDPEASVPGPAVADGGARTAKASRSSRTQ